MATKKTSPKKVTDEPAEAPVPTTNTKSGNWRDPNWTPAENDNSIDARMSRLTKELRG